MRMGAAKTRRYRRKGRRDPKSRFAWAISWGVDMNGRLQRSFSYGDLSASIARFLALVIVTLLATISLGKWGVGVLSGSWMKHSWGGGYVMHFAMLAVALALIAIIKPGFDGNFGLTWPRGRSYIWTGIWIGALGGLLMLAVDHYPELLAHRPPHGPYSTKLDNMLPWLLMQGIFVGISEEIVFRSLFLGYLYARITRRVRIGPTDISAAGIFVALFFSLAHADTFWHTDFISALGQQIYAIGYGLLGAWLFEKSGSVVAPICAHNAGDLVEWGCRFALTSAWT
jgi:membrane protease YdiL (CAAX protease family)